MEVVHLGQTELPKDVVEEYIQSMEAVYTPEVGCFKKGTRTKAELTKCLQSYDLFLHNCNNFTHDLATFLIGKGIPEHIRNLPQTFLNTPFGQMMKPQIEMALRGVTQGSGTAGVPQPPPAAGVHHHPPLAAAAGPGHTPGPGHTATGGTAATAVPHGTVRIVSNMQQLDEQFAQAARRKAGVAIFFTSATCPPCKMVYPTYDELAEEAGDRAVLVKVDISTALDVGMKYGVRATPTFMTFLRREQKIDEWSGANPGQLRGNVRLLIQMGMGMMNQHPHRKLQLPSLQRVISQYILYKKVPPLEKVCAKVAPYDKGPAITSLIEFLQARNTTNTADIPIPDTLPSIATYLQTTPQHLPRENHFAVVDLARLLFLDPRVSGYFAERDPDHKTLFSLLSLASSSPPSASPAGAAGGAAPHETENERKPPYNLRMVLLQLICNLFTTPLYTTHHLATNHVLRSTCLTLATTGALLDDTASAPASLRVAATSCIYNFAVLNHNARLESSGSGSGRADQQPDSEPLSEEEQVELTAAVIEALGREEESGETVRGLVVALGLLVYEADAAAEEGEGEGAVVDVCRAMGVEEVLKGKRERFGKEGELIKEVGRLFE